MAFSAATVKELREKSGAGMMDCKSALQENDGNIEISIDWLRKKGLSAAAKKSGRVAAEGLIGISVSKTSGSILEINSETDFVSRNDLFQNFVRTCSDLALSSPDIEILKNMQYPNTGRNVQEQLTHNIATIGENMNIRRLESLNIDDGKIISYIHNSVSEGLGRLGVLVALKTVSNDEKINILGKQIAMHIAATSPESLNIEDLDENLIQREKQVLIDQAIASGKPKEIAEKMVIGRMQKFYQEVVLNEQIFVIDGQTKIKDVVINLAKELNIEVKLAGFKKLTLGEGIHVESTDFAAEVAATSKVN